VSAQRLVVRERQPAFLPPPRAASQNYTTTHVVSFIQFLPLAHTGVGYYIFCCYTITAFDCIRTQFILMSTMAHNNSYSNLCNDVQSGEYTPPRSEKCLQ